MKHSIILVMSVFVLSCYGQEKKTNSEIVFSSVNVIPMDKEGVLENQDVVVNNGRIVSIGNTKKVKHGKNAIVVDGRGKFLLPGLAEMHAHVPPNGDLEQMKDVLLLFTAYGITNIRGMLGHPKHLELRNMINNGTVIGPRFITAGPAMSGETVQNAEQANSRVREQKKAGYDFLKILPGLTIDNYNAVVKTADEVGIPFAGHVPFDVGVWRAIAAHQQTIDHLDAFVEGLIPQTEKISEEDAGLFALYVADRADTSKIPDLVKGLKDNHVWVVPTQSLAERWFSPAHTAESFRADPEMKYMQPTVVDNWVQAKTNLVNSAKYDSAKVEKLIQLRRKLIYECNRNGVGLLLGSDAPQIFNVPGISTHYELKYLVDAGLTPYEALKTGTANAGKFYHKENEIGVIKNGASSDLLLLNANPLEDINNTTKIDGVMLRSQWFDRKSLDEMLKKLEKK